MAISSQCASLIAPPCPPFANFSDSREASARRRPSRLSVHDVSFVETVEAAAAEIGKIFEISGQERDDPIFAAARVVETLDLAPIERLWPVELRVNDAAGEINGAEAGGRIVLQGGRGEIGAVGMADVMESGVGIGGLHAHVVVHEPFDLVLSDPRQDERRIGK